MKSTYSFSLLIALLSLNMLFTGCGKETPTETPNAPETQEGEVTLTDGQLSKLGIRTVATTMRSMSGTLTASGMLDVPPQNLASISAPFGGFLQSTPLLQGSPVQRGQQIALLQDPEYVTMQQTYLEDMAQLTYLESEYKRQQELADQNANARKTLEKAKADYEVLQARIKGQRVRLEMLNIDLAALEQGKIVKSVPIYSPISGYVTQVNVNLGSHVAPSDVLFRVADTGHLHAELKVFEQDLPRLAIGQRVRVRLSNEAQERMGTVHLIGREVGEDRSVKVHVHFDTEAPDLVPGTFLQAEIEAAAQTVQALPTSAIVNWAGAAHVFVQRGAGRYGLVTVETGLQDSAFTEVRLPAGMGAGAAFVDHGAYDLLAVLKNEE